MNLNTICFLEHVYIHLNCLATDRNIARDKLIVASSNHIKFGSIQPIHVMWCSKSKSTAFVSSFLSIVSHQTYSLMIRDCVSTHAPIHHIFPNTFLYEQDLLLQIFSAHAQTSIDWV
eukprot:1152208_1